MGIRKLAKPVMLGAGRARILNQKVIVLESLVFNCPIFIFSLLFFTEFTLKYVFYPSISNLLRSTTLQFVNPKLIRKMVFKRPLKYKCMKLHKCFECVVIHLCALKRSTYQPFQVRNGAKNL